MSSSAVHGYRFAEFTLDCARRRLTKSGQEPIPVPARAFDVLAFLLVHRDRLVTKQELLDEVWPRLVVEENNLTQAISTLRRLLGDTRESPRFIATIAGRGYQFVASAQPLVDDIDALSAADAVAAPALLETAVASTAASPAPMTRRRWMIAAGTTAVALTVGGIWAMRSLRQAPLPATIAVLPFKPLLSMSRNEAIEFGVAELLINRLSALPGIVVSPLSSVRRYSSLEQDPLAAGRALGVAAVVDGYVQIRQGDVRLTARLLDVATGQAIWAGSFTERLGNFFAVQDSLTTQLVTALPVELPDSARRRLVAHSTADGEAWQLYANGRYLVERRDQQSIRRARDFFEAAIARDPRFTLAITGLSEAWALFGTFALAPPREAFERARAAAKRALEIDPRLPAALVALGHVKTQLDHDWKGARSLYHQALALEPRAAWTHAFLALNTVQSESIDTALDHIGRAQTLEPAAFPFMALGGFIRYFARQFDVARRELSRVLESVPGAALPRHFLARVLLAQGDAAAVIGLLEGHETPAPGSYSNLGRAYAMVGRLDDARAQIASVEAAGARGFGVACDLAQVHLALGDRNRALDSLERALRDDSQMIGYLNVDPAFDAIRDEPRFRAVGRKLGLA